MWTIYEKRNKMIRPLPSEAELRYHGLMKVWGNDTMFLSGGFERHPAYEEILKLKDSVDLVPLLFWDMLKYPHQCFPLLHQLVPDLPQLPDNNLGKISEIIEYWFDWAKANGRLEKRKDER